MDSKFKTKAREDGKQLNLYYPESGAVYSLREIEASLYLRDSPFLGFTHEGIKSCVQGQPDINYDLPSIIADSQWRYVRETDEWIPVFQYAGQTPLDELLHIVPSLDYNSGKRDGGYYAHFKGHEEKQYLADGVVPAPDEVEPEFQPDTNYADDTQRFQVEFVRKFIPDLGIAEAVEKYALYRSYRDEGQTQSVSRRYAGL